LTWTEPADTRHRYAPLAKLQAPKMNSLKNLLNKVFESAPPANSPNPPREESAFEWNPDEETVAPTSAQAPSWRRNDTVDEVSRRAADPGPDLVALSPAPPAPVFVPPPVPAPVAEVSVAEEAPFIAKSTAAPAFDAPAAALAPGVHPAQSMVPLSDFEDVYRKAGIKSPVHGYGVERVYRLLTSRRLVGLDRNVRRSALLTALDAAGVPASDVSQDAVLRRKALTAYEAEKALELQSLRSRNESRVEALQDTIETFTRQKQTQIERLAQGSTAAVRAQSDLEIRKRMEQDRLYRSLAYFVEPLPAPSPEIQGGFTEAPRPAPRMDAPRMDATIEVEQVAPPEPPPTQGPALGLEAALRAAAEEARAAGWGQTSVVEDGGADSAETLRKVREAGKTESES